MLGFLNTFSPARVVTKFVFRGIKFVGKMLWKGLKKLAGLGLALLVGLFTLGKKFVNTVASWTLKLAKGVKDKTYRFIIKPIASMLTSITSFFVGMVMAPINFMKWLIPNILEKIANCMHAIS